MAELLVVAGGVSSFITIAGFCLDLVDKAKDVMNAPKDVRSLVQELKVLGKSVEGV